MAKGMAFIYPYVIDKGVGLQPAPYWRTGPSVIPVFASNPIWQAYYLDAWESIEADPRTYEVLRNLPLRHPLLWVPPT